MGRPPLLSHPEDRTSSQGSPLQTLSLLPDQLVHYLLRLDGTYVMVLIHVVILAGPRPTWMLGNVLKLMGNGALTYPQELRKQYGPIFKVYVTFSAGMISQPV